MPYVQRTDGAVTGVFANPQPGFAEEFLAPDHAGVQAYQKLDLASVKAEKTAAAWAESQRRFAASSIDVVVGGASRTYRCDQTTRENISVINGMISRSPALVANPRAFTPSGSAPVDTTHDEFLAIYAAGIAKGDAFYQAYYVHKTAIAALTTAEAVAAYDLSLGWPL